jgi:hypothetical protein
MRKRPLCPPNYFDVTDQKKPTARENLQGTEQKRAVSKGRCVVFLSGADFHPTRKSIWQLW